MMVTILRLGDEEKKGKGCTEYRVGIREKFLIVSLFGFMCPTFSLRCTVRPTCTESLNTTNHHRWKGNVTQ
jgi:hypothetical protein